MMGDCEAYPVHDRFPDEGDGVATTVTPLMQHRARMLQFCQAMSEVRAVLPIAEFLEPTECRLPLTHDRRFDGPSTRRKSLSAGRVAL
jgi:hypothetical protein